MADRFLTDEEKKMIEDHALGGYSDSVQTRLQAAEAVCRAAHDIQTNWSYSATMMQLRVLRQALAAWEAACKS